MEWLLEQLSTSLNPCSVKDAAEYFVISPVVIMGH